jgi:polyphosphate kinase
MDNNQYIKTNRELSWLDFNFRVLEEAKDKRNPLLERLKFLAITSSNLDEFFMDRVASLHAQILSGYLTRDPSGMTAREQLNEVIKKTHKLAKEQSSTYKELFDALLVEGVQILRHNELTPDQKEYCSRYFYRIIQPVLTPLAVDASRPFPEVLGRSINLAVSLYDNDKNTLYALVQVPSLLSRFIELEEKNKFILIEDILLLHISSLFEGYTIKGVALFRATRDGDIEIDEDVSNIMDEIEKSLQKRRRGQPVRLELMKDFSNSNEDKKLIDFLIRKLNTNERDIYIQDMPLDLTFLFSFPSKSGFKEHRFKPLPPQTPVMLKNSDDIFRKIKEHDILVQHPYESFDCVIDFIEKAADDPNVLAIKQTLYRISGKSPIVSALIRAVESGKQVTVLVELKARFDEENNIAWAKTLEQAGCHVIYGLVGLKVHCKVLLVMRSEEDGIQRYLHLSTGNYNETTAKLYTDTGMFTAKEEYCSDASALFNMLSGYSIPPGFKKFKVAPTYLRKFFIDAIDREIDFAKAGKKAHITVKINSLIDSEIIDKFYEASQAGVKIDLIIRGINGLRSGIEGLSENIRIISIVSKYLEHDRIYKFYAGGKNLIYLSSADLMPRNLNRRIEVLFPIEDKVSKERIEKTLDIILNDNVKAREQKPDGSYQYVQNALPETNAQFALYKYIGEHLVDEKTIKTNNFIPIKKNNEP